MGNKFDLNAVNRYVRSDAEAIDVLIENDVNAYRLLNNLNRRVTRLERRSAYRGIISLAVIAGFIGFYADYCNQTDTTNSRLRSIESQLEAYYASKNTHSYEV